MGVLTLLAVASTRAYALEAPPAAEAGRLVSGELTRVDLAHRSVSVKTEGRDAREVEAAAGAGTRVISRGRALRFEDLHAGDRVVLACARADGPCEARVIRVVARVAVPSPSPLPPSPAASGENLNLSIEARRTTCPSGSSWRWRWRSCRWRR
jgi:hypothetical protein